MTTHASPSTVGVLLAGGAAKRLGGGDKGLREIAGQSLLQRVITRMTPQCDRLVLSANGDLARFAAFNLPVISDRTAEPLGPLGGILTGLDDIAATDDGPEWIVSIPTDSPFLPADLVTKLHAARGDAKIVIAASGGRIHPVIGLWHVSLRADLYHALVGEDVRKAQTFVARHPHATVTWPAEPIDPFFNVNGPDDLREAERLAMTHPTA